MLRSSPPPTVSYTTMLAKITTCERIYGWLEGGGGGISEIYTIAFKIHWFSLMGH